jgi:hypothetical protein
VCVSGILEARFEENIRGDDRAQLSAAPVCRSQALRDSAQYYLKTPVADQPVIWEPTAIDHQTDPH